ncbi:sugar phosphate isomerase/epimerase [Albibacterium sp.]|uniref:sugar phosphate isomerase/epimerase family protein n=1 Tax=Albibacterium sp. TaxID=2952885 RepID=UPI002C000DC2|nr:sugar phosphate isomerase/epimerase [Albibacterium sp.]HUH19690.1 sugar phosphate isomerase/epimerase [Albibacterium sp.]
MKQRRDFIKNLSALALGSVFLPSLAEASIKGSSLGKVKDIGIQLYTVRKEMLTDPTGTLKQLAALGIKEIESASDPAKGAYYGLQPKEMKQICKDLGMTLRSGHVSLNGQWQQTMDNAAESGQEYLIVSSLPSRGQTVDNYKKISEMFNKAGEECEKLNIKFGYHNHGEEFQEENGQILFDVLLNNTDPKLVHMEMDIGWVVAAGKDPIQYFKNFSGRFPLWHLKDMNGNTSTEFGKGSLDVVNLLKNRKLSGLKYFFVEQEEYTSTPMESMKQNMEYLHNLDI